MEHHNGRGPDQTGPASRYWRIRTALEIVKFAAWTALYAFHVVNEAGGGVFPSLI